MLSSSKKPVRLTGDLDGDGDVDNNDLSIFFRYWLNKTKNSPADLNLDGKVDQKDLNIMLQA